MSLRQSCSESTGFQTTDDTDTFEDRSIIDDEHTDDDDDDEEEDDVSTSDDDDEDESSTDSDDDDDDDTEEDDEEGEEGYRNEKEPERDDDASFLVPIEKNRSPNKLARTEKQQAQQRRMVLNLSSSGTISSVRGDDEEEDYQTDDATRTDGGFSTAGNTTDGGNEGGYSTAGEYTTGGHSQTTHEDRGGGYTTEGGYTTATGTGTVSFATRSDEDTDEDGESTFDEDEDNETNRDYSAPGVNTLSTGEFGRSGSTYSVASQSTATTQPTSPSRKKVTMLTIDDMDGDGGNSLADLATPDIHNRTSFLQSSITPRTGHGKSVLVDSVLPPQQMSPRMKKRVPGGAAAKLMLLGPRGSKESEESEFIEHMSSTESSVKINPDSVLAAEMERVKEEFSTGITKLDRNKMIPPSLTGAESESKNEKDDPETSMSLSMKPSFLNRNEIFHSSASDAVAALLKPRQISPIHEGVAIVTASTVPFFSSPRGGGIPRTPDSTATSAGVTNPSNTSSVVSSELISVETKRKVEELETKMMHPTKTLTDLLTAIATPDDAIPDQLAYAVRRKNACGALLTLTTNAANRVRICWTSGVLPALKSVLADGLIVNGESTSPLFIEDDRIRTEYDAARNRAISALMNLCMPVKNRIAVFHSPGLVHVVLEAMDQDHGIARKGCSAILAFLAKSSENRLLMAQIPGLIDVARKILKPRPARVEVVTTPIMKEKKSYPWSDDDDATSTSSSARDPNKIGSGTTESGTRDGRRSSSRKNRPGLSFVSTTSSFQSYDDSGDTPKVEGANSPREVTGYDETADDLLQAARQNVFAMLGHLVKEKDNAYHLARVVTLVTILVDVSQCHESPSHALAVKIIANLTRHRLNKVLAFKPKTIVPALVEATQSRNDDARLYACYALQNLSQEKSCRQELAIAEHLIEVLCDRCRNGTLDAERLAAVSTLKNLCDEPANLIPLTNTMGCVTTLMQLAHSPAPTLSSITIPTLIVDSDAPPETSSGSRVITELMQYRACDALATLSHWLRKIATSGHSLDQTQRGRTPNKGLFVPSLREVSWNQWT